MTATMRKWGVSDPAIGQRIQEARLAKGLSQRAAIKDTPYTAAYISRIEGGTRTPSVTFLRSIASTLGVSPLWLETGLPLVDVRLTLIQAERLLGTATVDRDWGLVQTLISALGLDHDDYVTGLA